jgi:DNA polymerase-1
LKWLAKYYLDFPDDDEKILKDATKEAARYCKSNDIEVTLGRSPTGEREVEADFWLPKVIHKGNTLCLDYAKKDVERTTLLWVFFKDLLDEEGLWKAYERERQLLQTVYRIETHGITVSRKRLDAKIKALGRERDEYFEKAQSFVKRNLKTEINLASSQQLGEFLHTKLKLPVLARSEKSNQPKTNKETLEALLGLAADKDGGCYNLRAANFLRNLLCGRAYDSGVKYLLNYKAYEVPHANKDFIVLYPSLNQSGTDTTRFSSSNPNGQNVSKLALIEIAGEELPGPRLRDVYGPPPGKVWYAIDYNQLELRTFAKCSNDQQLLQALEEGEDFHSYVAVQMHEKPADEITKAERKSAKYVVFGRIFGAGKARIDKLAGFAGANDLFSRKLPNVAAFMKKVIAEVRKLGYVFTLDGYRLDVPRQLAYKAVNYLAQGSAGSIIKNAMIAIDRKGLVDWITSRIVLQIHDELIIEVDEEHDSPEFVYNIMREMEQAGEDVRVSTPVSCERISKDWGHGEEVEVTRKTIKPIKKAA